MSRCLLMLVVLSAVLSSHRSGEAFVSPERQFMHGQMDRKDVRLARSVCRLTIVRGLIVHPKAINLDNNTTIFTSPVHHLQLAPTLFRLPPPTLA